MLYPSWYRYLQMASHLQLPVRELRAGDLVPLLSLLLEKVPVMRRRIKSLLSDMPALAMVLILIAVVVGAGAVGLWIKANFV